MTLAPEDMFASMLIVAALFSDAVASEALPNLRGVAYPEARSRLISEGYAPVRITRRASWLACPYEDDCKLYPELLQCSGSGIALCDFVYQKRKGGRYVIVTTYGEDRRKVQSLSYAIRNNMAGWTPGVL